MLSIGTCFLIGGKLYARISSVTFPPYISHGDDPNITFFAFIMELEIWNPSILTRYEHTSNYNFDFDPCIDVTFTNLTGYNTHVVIDDFQELNYDEYIVVFDGIKMLATNIQVLKSGINIETSGYYMMFNEGNLTRLPMVDYRMWFKIPLMFGKETISNGVTMQVFENETFVTYDTISEGWGRVSPLRSCLLYYIVGVVMIIIPIVKKFEKKREKGLLH